MKKNTLQNIVRFLVKKFTIAEYYGLENIPKEGGVILALNHLSYFDTPLLFTNPVRPDVTALVTTKYLIHPFVAWFTNTAGGIWINRDIADFSAIQKAAKVLAEGVALGISPEGTRSKNGQLQEGKPGTLILALKSGAPIVPVAITGTESALSDLSHFRRPRIAARFGKPFFVPPIEPRNRSKELKKWTHELMVRIAALLPESYRGFYKDHIT